MCVREAKTWRERKAKIQIEKTQREKHYFSFTHFSVVGHLSSYYNLTIIKCPGTNTNVQRSPLYIDLESFG